MTNVVWMFLVITDAMLVMVAKFVCSKHDEIFPQVGDNNISSQFGWIDWITHSQDYKVERVSKWIEWTDIGNAMPKVSSSPPAF